MSNLKMGCIQRSRDRLNMWLQQAGLLQNHRIGSIAACSGVPSSCSNAARSRGINKPVCASVRSQIKCVKARRRCSVGSFHSSKITRVPRLQKIEGRWCVTEPIIGASPGCRQIRKLLANKVMKVLIDVQDGSSILTPKSIEGSYKERRGAKAPVVAFYMFLNTLEKKSQSFLWVVCNEGSKIFSTLIP